MQKRQTSKKIRKDYIIVGLLVSLYLFCIAVLILSFYLTPESSEDDFIKFNNMQELLLKHKLSKDRNLTEDTSKITEFNRTYKIIPYKLIEEDYTGKNKIIIPFTVERDSIIYSNGVLGYFKSSVYTDTIIHKVRSDLTTAYAFEIINQRIFGYTLQNPYSPKNLVYRLFNWFRINVIEVLLLLVYALIIYVIMAFVLGYKYIRRTSKCDVQTDIAYLPNRTNMGNSAGFGMGFISASILNLAYLYRLIGVDANILVWSIIILIFISSFAS